jgi:hypothetical protein
MQVPCLGCKQPVEIRQPSAPRIVNMPSVSMIVLEHPEQGFCPGCGVPVTAQISQLGGLALVAAPVPPSEQTLIVVPR